MQRQESSGDEGADGPPDPDIGQRIDALLVFMPLMEAGVAGAWDGGKKQADGTIMMPWFDYSDEVMQFRRACGENGWIEPYEWPAWQQEAVEYYRRPELLDGADVATLRKLLTLHIRKDRFSEGHLAAMIESGHIAAILRRLRDIRQGAGEHAPDRR